MPCRRCGKNPVGPSGKSAKRCQWQKKRAGFEEVPRLAATTVAGNRLARRWATAGPYERVARGAMGGRPQGSPLRRITRGRGTAGRCRHRPLRRFDKKVSAWNPPSRGFAVTAPFRQGGQGDGGCGCPCCGAQNFCAALRRTLEILTAATLSPRFFCHWQRSVRSPQPVCELASQ